MLDAEDPEVEQVRAEMEEVLDLKERSIAIDIGMPHLKLKQQHPSVASECVACEKLAYILVHHRV